MASSFIPSGIEQPELIALDKAGKQIKLLIVGFSIDGGKAVPITWPHADGLPIYQRAGGQYRRFDLASGLASGESFTNLAEVTK